MFYTVTIFYKILQNMILFRDIMSGRFFHDVYLYIYDEYYTIFITNINKKDLF